jgi:transposase-like protein
MKMKRITSLTAGLAFVLMVLTSIVLYIVPQGRVAYWADWRLWGLSKTDWGNIHINLGLLFLIALFLHVYYNWKPITAYMKDKTKKLKVFTPDFNVALIVTIVFVLGTHLMIPPFSWVLNLGDSIKDRGAVKYGEPPYGHAELSSLKTFAQKMNLDLGQSHKLLEQAGYVAENDNVTLAALAKQYGVTPQQIYFVIKDAENKPAKDGETGTDKFSIPDNPPPGTGNLTLADFCTRYSMNLKAVLRELKKREINAAEAQTLKTIASEEGIGPTDLYYILREIAKLGYKF